MVGLQRANPYHLRPLSVLLLCNLAGLWHVIELGQIYVLLLGLVAAAWFLLRSGRFTSAGLALALLVAIKPPFVLLAVLLFLAGHRRSGAIAVGLAVAVSAIPILIDGVGIYEQWLSVSRELTPVLIQGPGNGSLAGFAGRFMPPSVGMALSSLMMAGAAWLCWRLRPDAMTAFSLGIVLVLLAGPLTWPGYGLLLLPILLSRQWHKWEWLAAGILAIPPALMISMFASTPGELLLGSVYFWAFAILGVLLAKEVIATSFLIQPTNINVSNVSRTAA
jgi:hypothetical protein